MLPEGKVKILAEDKYHQVVGQPQVDGLACGHTRVGGVWDVPVFGGPHPGLSTGAGSLKTGNYYYDIGSGPYIIVITVTSTYMIKLYIMGALILESMGEPII